VGKAKIQEVKRHLDGRVETFDCEPVSVEDDSAVVRFRLPARVGEWPRGTTTLGFFWENRSYNLYRFLSPDGDLLGHRLDVVAEVSVGQDRIEYLDLIVDVVVSATGDIHVEDEDEAKKAAAKGLLEPAHLEAIESALGTILRDPRRIFRDADALLPKE
jgi:protein associated with RNAse G/E